MIASDHPELGLRRLMAPIAAAALVIASGSAVDAAPVVEITGSVVDASTGEPVPARLYVLRNADGTHHFVEPGGDAGDSARAVVYDRQNWVNPKSIERHTSLGAHPFRARLEPGAYTFTAARGTEYLDAVVQVEVAADRPSAPVQIRLARWVDMAARGWHSGDTHVHRTLADLPTVMLSEDVNVVFPLTHWVTRAFTPPTRGDKNVDAPAPGETPALIKVDERHVIWPLNTEYEIFTVGDRRHTLGAVFVLNQKAVLELGVPPVGKVAEEARRQGALLDMDKHDWPWALCLPPLMGIDLYELANNHLWRTEFGFTTWNAPAAEFMGLRGGKEGGDERDWIDYTHRTYWSLLNLGFHLRPTAGTANGVHPVPLGFGRVYVHTPAGFSYETWIEGLRAGRSFVTTGPMVIATLSGSPPGSVIRSTGSAAEGLPRMEAVVVSRRRPQRIEIIVDGTIVRTIAPDKSFASDIGAVTTLVEHPLAFERSGWVAMRVWEVEADGRPRFAHTAPWFIAVPGRPAIPRREEVDYFVKRVRDEIERSRGILPEAAIAEFEAAARRYESAAAAETSP